MMDPEFELLLRSDDIRDILGDSKDVGELLDIPSDIEGGDIVVENDEVPDDSFVLRDQLYSFSSDSESDEK